MLRTREPLLKRPFRVPGYPVAPGLFLLGAPLLMVGAVIDADPSAAHALGVLIAGVALSFVSPWFAKQRSERKS